MENIFSGEEKKQQYLILILGVLVLAIIIVAKQFFLAPSQSPKLAELTTLNLPKVRINFEILKNPIFQELQLFEEIPPFEGEAGRENPFVEY